MKPGAGPEAGTTIRSDKIEIFRTVRGATAPATCLRRGAGHGRWLTVPVRTGRTAHRPGSRAELLGCAGTAADAAGDGRCWAALYRGQEALDLLRPALDRPEAREDPELFAAALLTAANAARFVDIAVARQLGKRAVILARQLDAARLLIPSLGDRFVMAYASLGLACLASDAGDWNRAAVLHGVAQAFLDRTGQPWQEVEAHYRQDSLDQVRGHLGHEQFEQAYASGMGLSSDEALDLAAGKDRPAG